MNTKTLTYVAAYLVVGYGLFYYFKRFHLSSQEKDLVIISTRDLANFDKGFTKEWAKAIKAKQPNFSYIGRNFSTQTGKAIS
jgi:hypothetical protein